MEKSSTDFAATRTQLWHNAWLGDTLQYGIFTPEKISPPRARFDEVALALPSTSIDLSHNRACIAHIAAHKRFGGERFHPGSLKPIQIALVSLVEDARVEQLALRERPGLRHLWEPYFQTIDLQNAALLNLLKRLARALFYIDANSIFDEPERHAWVLKGRKLFVQRKQEWNNAAISREIGRLLGNDLGQMRAQFNWKSYVVEPAYRDDNSGLWLLPKDEKETQTIALSQHFQSETHAAQPLADNTQAHAGYGENMVGQEAEKTEIFALPEWDYVLQRYRNEWVQLREFACASGNAHTIEQFLAHHAAAIKRTGSKLQKIRARRLIKLRRQHDGDDFDLDACIENRIALARGDNINPRIYRTLRPQCSEFALSLLLDASQSTADITSDNRSYFQHAINATAWFGQAIMATGDSFSINAFHSSGRSDVRLFPIKQFSEHWDEAILARLASIEPKLSTRLGSALRHAQTQLQMQNLQALARTQSQRQILFVLSDGEPADIDCFDQRYLREDARRAVHELTQAGISVFCIALARDAETALVEIFGRRRVLACPHIEKLGQQLQRLYAQIAQ